MFGHRASKVGYALTLVGIPGVVFITYLQVWLSKHFDVSDVVLIMNILSTLAAWMSFGGLTMIICGVLARGFERIEAAILARTVDQMEERQ